MKRLINSLLFLTIIICFISCEKETAIHQQQSELTYAKANPGGCNNQNFSGLKSATIENDTVYFSTNNDTLKIFAGINYICCAPFETDVNVSNDSILISLNDTCPKPDLSCYCKCNCYYTWDFLFVDFVEGSYYLQVELNDPRLNETFIITQQRIDV